MTAEMRLIGDPAELSAIESALAFVLKMSGRRRYPSRRSEDELRYYRVGTVDNPVVPAKHTIDLKRVDDLKIEMSDLNGRNHVLVCADFAAPGYIEYGLAASLNTEFQDSIRRIIHSELKDVHFRLDQSYRPAHQSIAVYHSGNDWLTVPYDCRYDWMGGDD